MYSVQNWDSAHHISFWRNWWGIRELSFHGDRRTSIHYVIIWTFHINIIMNPGVKASRAFPLGYLSCHLCHPSSLTKGRNISSILTRPSWPSCSNLPRQNSIDLGQTSRDRVILPTCFSRQNGRGVSFHLSQINLPRPMAEPYVEFF